MTKLLAAPSLGAKAQCDLDNGGGGSAIFRLAVAGQAVQGHFSNHNAMLDTGSSKRAAISTRIPINTCRQQTRYQRDRQGRVE